MAPSDTVSIRIHKDALPYIVEHLESGIEEAKDVLLKTHSDNIADTIEDHLNLVLIQQGRLSALAYTLDQFRFVLSEEEK